MDILPSSQTVTINPSAYLLALHHSSQFSTCMSGRNLPRKLDVTKGADVLMYEVPAWLLGDEPPSSVNGGRSQASRALRQIQTTKIALRTSHNRYQIAHFQNLQPVSSRVQLARTSRVVELILPGPNLFFASSPSHARSPASRKSKCTLSIATSAARPAQSPFLHNYTILNILHR